MPPVKVEVAVDVAVMYPIVGLPVALTVVADVQYVRSPTDPPESAVAPSVTHVPLTEKHPAVRLMPCANVDVAEPVELNWFAATPPVNVDVEVLAPVTLM